MGGVGHIAPGQGFEKTYFGFVRHGFGVNV